MIPSTEPASPVDPRSDAPQGDGLAPIRRKPDRWEVALTARNWRITCESYENARRVPDLLGAEATKGVA